MSWLEAIVLGIAQGLTEFLPISSTAHLRIIPAFAGWEDPGAFFTAVVQLGTMAAVVIYFWRDLVRIVRTWFLSLRRPELRGELDARMGWYVIVATIPIVIFGVAFRDQIENGARNLYLIGVTLIVLGLILLAADRTARLARDVDDVTHARRRVGRPGPGARADPGRRRAPAPPSRPGSSWASSARRRPASRSCCRCRRSSSAGSTGYWRSSPAPTTSASARSAGRRSSPSSSGTSRSPSCCASWRPTRCWCSSSTAWCSARS